VEVQRQLGGGPALAEGTRQLRDRPG
jgi:hypothetical protein